MGAWIRLYQTPMANCIWEPPRVTRVGGVFAKTDTNRPHFRCSDQPALKRSVKPGGLTSQSLIEKIREGNQKTLVGLVGLCTHCMACLASRGSHRQLVSNSKALFKGPRSKLL